MEYAILNTDFEIVEYRQYTEELRAGQIKHHNGRPLAMKVVSFAQPSYNPQYQRVVKNDVVDDSQVTRNWVVEDLVSLADFKTQLKKQIDDAAEVIRSRYITGGYGQAMTYMQKKEEAIGFFNDEAPEASNYPMLTSLIGVDGDSLVEVAQLVRNRYEQWIQLGAAIETIRLSAKRAIDAASTSSEAFDTYELISWDLA